MTKARRSGRIALMESRSLDVQAPAKINAHLDIGQVRQDGYHDLRSLFVKIDLYDRLVVTYTPGRDFSCSVSGNMEIPVEENTIYRASSVFARAAGFTGSITVDCRKQIPQQAGLGGGSSDAAAVLRALNELSGNRLTGAQLLETALQVGSDVPFFLSGSPAVVTGRGEYVRPLDLGQRSLHGILLSPDFTVSTAAAFSELDMKYAAMKYSPEWKLTEEEIAAEYLEPCSSWRFENSFSPWLEQTYPRYAAMKQLLLQAGAEFVTVSGSGSSLCGLSECPLSLSGALISRAAALRCTIFAIKTLAD